MPESKKAQLSFIGVSLELFSVVVCQGQWVIWPLFSLIKRQERLIELRR